MNIAHLFFLLYSNFLDLMLTRLLLAGCPHRFQNVQICSESSPRPERMALGAHLDQITLNADLPALLKWASYWRYFPSPEYRQSFGDKEAAGWRWVGRSWGAGSDWWRHASQCAPGWVWSFGQRKLRLLADGYPESTRPSGWKTPTSPPTEVNTVTFQTHLHSHQSSHVSACFLTSVHCISGASCSPFRATLCDVVRVVIYLFTLLSLCALLDTIPELGGSKLSVNSLCFCKSSLSCKCWFFKHKWMLSEY